MIENLIFERLRKHVRFLSDQISFFPTSEETHNFIYIWSEMFQIQFSLVFFAGLKSLFDLY